MATVAIGPEQPGIGSWAWLGRALVSIVERQHTVAQFRNRVPQCDVVLLIKSFPAAEDMLLLAAQRRVVYCPIDRYGSSADIDRHGLLLQRLAMVVLNAESLRHYFQSYTTTTYCDHPLGYVAEPPITFKTDGPILAVAVKNNLPPLIEWTRENQLPDELWLLTDLPGGRDELSADRLGFSSETKVRVARWTPERHREWAATSRAALDIKGDTFRARHKPPAKTFDFVASGLPTALNSGHAARRDLAAIGLTAADPQDTEQWFSRDYWDQTQHVAVRLRSRLSQEQVAADWLAVIDRALETGDKS